MSEHRSARLDATPKGRVEAAIRNLYAAAHLPDPEVVVFDDAEAFNDAADALVSYAPLNFGMLLSFVPMILVSGSGVALVISIVKELSFFSLTGLLMDSATPQASALEQILQMDLSWMFNLAFVVLVTTFSLHIMLGISVLPFGNVWRWGAARRLARRAGIDGERIRLALAAPDTLTAGLASATQTLTRFNVFHGEALRFGTLRVAAEVRDHPEASILIERAAAVVDLAGDLVGRHGIVAVLLARELSGAVRRTLRGLAGSSEGDRPKRLLRALSTLGVEDAQALLGAVGHDEAARLLGLRPARWDEAGALYRFPAARTALCYVRVLDAVQDERGEPLVHWLPVPPHIATAHEGVAWSFGLREHAYRPTIEA